MGKLNIVLYEPLIPGNTGNIMRTCVATHTKLHLIEPLGFKLDESSIKRSGVNYIENCEYDTMTFYNSTYFNKNAKITTHAYDSYGCLVENCAVCAGYAKAYKLIMNRLGIECGCVTGIGTSSMGSGPHEWNYIKIDGEYYYVDVTWDDPLPFGYSDGTIRRDYFLLSKDEIMKDHSFDNDQYLPN